MQPQPDREGVHMYAAARIGSRLPVQDVYHVVRHLDQETQRMLDNLHSIVLIDQAEREGPPLSNPESSWLRIGLI